STDTCRTEGARRALPCVSRSPGESLPEPRCEAQNRPWEPTITGIRSCYKLATIVCAESNEIVTNLRRDTLHPRGFHHGASLLKRSVRVGLCVVHAREDSEVP